MARRGHSPDPDRVFWKLVAGLFGVALLGMAIDTLLMLPAVTLQRREAAAVYMICAMTLWILAGLWAMRNGR